MAIKTEDKEYTTVGKGAQHQYNAPHITSWEVSDGDIATLTSEALEFVGGDFKALKNVLENALNSYQRFKCAPGADPVEKALAFLKKMGLSVEDLTK